uniref:Uncharacterized protein n=1 Tax=Glossina austeni TaxID=7395 RepID=A0A1A9UGV9_GLOAU
MAEQGLPLHIYYTIPSCTKKELLYNNQDRRFSLQLKRIKLATNWKDERIVPVVAGHSNNLLLWSEEADSSFYSILRLNPLNLYHAFVLRTYAASNELINFKKFSNSGQVCTLPQRCSTDPNNKWGYCITIEALSFKFKASSNDDGEGSKFEIEVSFEVVCNYHSLFGCYSQQR